MNIENRSVYFNWSKKTVVFWNKYNEMTCTTYHAFSLTDDHVTFWWQCGLIMYLGYQSLYLHYKYWVLQIKLYINVQHLEWLQFKPNCLGIFFLSDYIAGPSNILRFVQQKKSFKEWDTFQNFQWQPFVANTRESIQDCRMDGWMAPFHRGSNNWNTLPKASLT